MEETHFSESSATEEEEAERFVEAVVERLKTNVSASQAVSYSDAILRNERLAAATRASGHKSKEPMQFIRLRVLGGRGFTNEILEEEDCSGSTQSHFVLHCQFAGQRLSSNPVPCSTQPNFRHDFIFAMPAVGSLKAAFKKRSSMSYHHGDESAHHDQEPSCSAADLLDIHDVLHIVLTRISPNTDAVLQSSHNMQWRNLLTSDSGLQHCFVELHGVYSETSLPIGILEVELQLMPQLSDSISPEVLSSQEDYEQSRQVESDRLLLNYVKQWWKDYLGIRPSHATRQVKLFAKDENGDSHLVCSLLRPLRADRLLDTPRQAARFASLLPLTSTPWMDGSSQNSPCWTSMLAFLARGHGGCEDHSVLLCCLLLGFGLNAFVCVGKQVNGDHHVWVATLDEDAGQVTFWESLTGQRCINTPPGGQVPAASASHIYSSIGCIFNHRSCYANIQASDRVADCRFVLEDRSCWKAVSDSAIQSVITRPTSPANNLPPIRPPSIAAHAISDELEKELRLAVQQHRKTLGLTCRWDHHLSFILTQALVSYESERCCGISFGNEEFQTAIRHYVKDGITFKAFPIQFAHTNPTRMLETCLRSPVFGDIISCRGDEVQFSLRVTTTAYPEDLVAVWLMLAVQYRSVL